MWEEEAAEESEYDVPGGGGTRADGEGGGRGEEPFWRSANWPLSIAIALRGGWRAEEAGGQGGERPEWIEVPPFAQERTVESPQGEEEQ